MASSASSSSSSSSSSNFKAQFYVIRGNGSFVPLLAMDELPTTVVVRNVPRVLEARETVGMISVGQYDSRHTHHGIEFTDGRASCIGSAPPRTFGIQEQPPSITSTPLITHASPVRIDCKAVVPPDTPADGRVSYPLPSWHESADLPRANGIKTYCSYWLRHGECDYAQQGCLYKHEMPLDLSVLRECGLRDIPRWYRELHGVGSLFAVYGSDASKGRDEARQGVHGDNWRDGPSSSSSSKTSIFKSHPVAGKSFPVTGIKNGLITYRDPHPMFAITGRRGFETCRAKLGRKDMSTRRAGSNTTSSALTGQVVNTGQVALMETVRQLNEYNKKEAKFKQDLALRASIKPVTVVEGPNSINTEANFSASPFSDDDMSISGSSQSAGPNPGSNTPATIYTVTGSEAEGDSDKNKPPLPYPNLSIGSGASIDSVKETVARCQSEQKKARQRAVNKVADALTATRAIEAAQTRSSPKSRGNPRGNRSGIAVAVERRARKESQSSVSSTGGIDGDAGSLDGSPCRRSPGRAKAKLQPIGDLLEGFESVASRCAASADPLDEPLNEAKILTVAKDECARETGRLEVGTKRYVPYDHDD